MSIDYNKLHSTRQNTLEFEILTDGGTVDVFHSLDRIPTRIIPVIPYEDANISIVEINNADKRIRFMATKAGIYKVLIN